MASLRNLDPILLEAFVAIADTGTFASAAGKIGRTTSAVSMQMKRLEANFPNNPIFEVRGRRKQLTQTGEILLSHARHIIQLNDSLWLSLAAADSPGLIRLGAPDDYVHALLPDILERYAKVFPHVQVDVTCEPSENLSALVDDDKLDLAVVTRRSHDAVSRTIRIEPIVWVAAKGKPPLSMDVLQLATFQTGCVARGKTIEACIRAGRHYRIAYSSPSIAGVLSAVRAGLAIAAIARCAVPADLEILPPSSQLPVVEGVDIALMRGTACRQPDYVQKLADEIHLSLAVA